MSLDKNATEEQQLRPISNLVEFTDRTLEHSFRWIGHRWFSNYGEIWTDDFDETVGSSFPSRFWGNREKSKENGERWCHRHRDWKNGLATNKLGANAPIVGGISKDGANWELGGAGPDGRQEVIALDRTKPTNLWAFPVPTTSQHDKCKELEGKEVWTREGVWRCLFPMDKRQVDYQVQKGSPSSGASSEDRKLFGDYTAYLDWKSAIRTAMREQKERDRVLARIQHERELEERQNRARLEKQRSEQDRLESERIALERINSMRVEKERLDREQRFRREQERFEADRQIQDARWDNDSYNPRRPVKAQWEAARGAPSAATDLGKAVASSTTTNETITKQDGSLETKQTIKTWYKDGTSSVTERITSAPQEQDGKKSGWFWK